MPNISGAKELMLELNSDRNKGLNKQIYSIVCSYHARQHFRVNLHSTVG